jgi:hypothetical protein
VSLFQRIDTEGREPWQSSVSLKAEDVISTPRSLLKTQAKDDDVSWWDRCRLPCGIGSTRPLDCALLFKTCCMKSHVVSSSCRSRVSIESSSRAAGGSPEVGCRGGMTVTITGAVSVSTGPCGSGTLLSIKRPPATWSAEYGGMLFSGSSQRSHCPGCQQVLRLRMRRLAPYPRRLEYMGRPPSESPPM